VYSGAVAPDAIQEKEFWSGLESLKSQEPDGAWLPKVIHTYRSQPFFAPLLLNYLTTDCSCGVKDPNVTCARRMVTKAKKSNVKLTVSFQANTIEAIERVQKDAPAGNLHDMVRYLVMRGLQSVEAEIAAAKAAK
jgi:hypothetical protein